ncbi:MAG TPA: metallophosphoesterase [Spirochaetota bacterium]|nr:metallophosphoesterase [Spirochaetota bacterium]
MKIIYLTDVHGSFNRIYELLLETVADVYIIAGDLIDIPFYNIDTAINYHELQTYFNALRRKNEKTGMLLEDFVDELIDDPTTDPGVQTKAYGYQQYTIRARRVMQQKYKVLENILSIKNNSEIFVLPGNYDMNLRYTALHERDLHMQWHEIEGMRVAGYGGADIWSAGIPERYIVDYRAGISIPDRNNEMFSFFKAVKPHIIVTHQPAHGIHDRITWKGPSGSPALRTYCDSSNVRLCLTGHIHDDWGFTFSENTVFLNPSNFGEVTTAKGEVAEGGFFHEIIMENSEIRKVHFKKFVNSNIFSLADYIHTDNSYTEEIADTERYTALKNGKNFDITAEKYSHIPEIELFKEIRSFFRQYQTPESENRMLELETILEKITEEVGDIAFDVAGSLNMGLSSSSSDIDIIIYMHLKNDCTNDCSLSGNYLKAIELLGRYMKDRYKYQVLDVINLDVVEKSIREENYECEVTQMFVLHRAVCRPVNYRVIAPVEDLLNRNTEFRKEIEGSARSFLQIFMTTTSHSTSFDKYLTRIKSLGVKIPDSINEKIRLYLDGGRYKNEKQ